MTPPLASIGGSHEKCMQYELLYIISATFADDDVGTVEAVVRALLEKNGATLTTTKRLGKFRFAYPIKKARYGHYVLVRFESEPSVVAKIEEGLRITSDVVRHLILRADEAGEETFDMVQFTEVNIEAKDDQRRRREKPATDDPAKKTDEIKSGVAVLEEGKEATAEKEAPAAAISDEELDKKLAAALEENS